MLERNRCTVARRIVTIGDFPSPAHLLVLGAGLATPIPMSHDLRKLPRRGRTGHVRQGGQYERVTGSDGAGLDPARDVPAHPTVVFGSGAGTGHVLSSPAGHAQRLSGNFYAATS